MDLLLQNKRICEFTKLKTKLELSKLVQVLRVSIKKVQIPNKKKSSLNLLGCPVKYLHIRSIPPKLKPAKISTSHAKLKQTCTLGVSMVN